MHERTSRAVARLLFVLLCAVPTAATMGTIVVTWTPWYHRRCLVELEASLYRETGLRVEVDDFERLTPTQIRLQGVRLIEPEMGREVARVRLVWWVTEGERTVIRMSQPEVQASELTHVWRLMHDRFLCRPEVLRGDTRFSASDLTVHGRGGALTLRDFDAWIRPLAQAVEVHAQCSPADGRFAANGRLQTDESDEGEPIRIDLVRDRSGDSPWTRCRIRSGQTPLPCPVLAEYLPWFGRLGHDATFSGSLMWQLTRDGWNVDLGGARFRRVDLGHLTESIPHRVTGEAEIHFQRCRWTPGEVVDVSGEISASRGYVSRSILDAARQHLGFETAELSDSAGDAPYDELALHFDFFGSDLELQGTCNRLSGYNHLPPGSALCVGGRSLAVSGGKRLLAVSLARAVAPEHSDFVPIAGQTRWLMGLLLPPKTPRPVDEAEPIVPRISSARGYTGGDAMIGQP